MNTPNHRCVVCVCVCVCMHACMRARHCVFVQVTFSEEELKQRLSDQEYHVTQERGTERYRKPS